MGAHATLKNEEVVSNCDIIFLAVKPHLLDDALSTIKKESDGKFEDKLFVSVLAGVTLKMLNDVSIQKDFDILICTIIYTLKKYV